MDARSPPYVDLGYDDNPTLTTTPRLNPRIATYDSVIREIIRSARMGCEIELCMEGGTASSNSVIIRPYQVYTRAHHHTPAPHHSPMPSESDSPAVDRAPQRQPLSFSMYGFDPYPWERERIHRYSVSRPMWWRVWLRLREFGAQVGIS